MINEKEMIDIIEILNKDKITTYLRRKFSTRAWNAFCDDVEPKILKLKSYLFREKLVKPVDSRMWIGSSKTMEIEGAN